ncbi:MAG TPA: GNAT family N-acetyltransferase, partial [Caldilineaceae bacterium]|nr:GNAT family N-acetyltransferase [Caldilineaceae bacterium]
PPILLAEGHEYTNFSCGEVGLDEWLARRALSNQLAGASRTYVVTVENRVVAYYALASGSVMAGEAPGRVRRNMPNPIPVIVLGRLAVDQRWQGQGLGAALLRDAVLRSLQAVEIVGIRAILVHALHEKAAAFYRNAGFRPSSISETVLMLTLADAAGALGAGSNAG